LKETSFCDGATAQDRDDIKHSVSFINNLSRTCLPIKSSKPI